MTLFWILAGLMVLGLLAMLVVPMFRGVSPLDDDQVADAASIDLFREQIASLEDQRQRGLAAPDVLDEARADLERELLERLGPARADRVSAAALEVAGNPLCARSRIATWMLAAALCAMLPAGAYLTYEAYGEPRALDPAALSAPVTPPAGVPDIATMVERLESRLAQQPDDGEGWFMLGRSYFVLKRYDDSVRALERAQALLEENADLLVTLAEAQAFAADNRLTGEPQRQLERALILEPRHAKGLWLAGFASLQAAEPDVALAHWTALMSLLPPDGEEATTLRTLMDGIASSSGLAPLAPRSPAQPAAGNPPEPAVSTVGGSGAPASAGTNTSTTGSLRIAVSLSPTLSAQAPEGATLFIFARNPDGPPMPLAVAKRTAGELPVSVELSDADAMVPQAKLSAANTVLITARIALGNNPIAQPGDLEGSAGPYTREALAGATAPISVVIDRVVP